MRLHNCVLQALALFALSCVHAELSAAMYVSDPVKGSKGGNGSKTSPWPGLQEVISSGKLNKLKPGDTLYLLSGFHGHAVFNGTNDDYITIAAAKGHTPQLSHMEFNGTKWRIKGLTVSASLGPAGFKGNMIKFAEGRGSSHITVEDCFVYGLLDHSGLDTPKWKDMPSGILMGRHGSGHVVRNNYVLNVRFGIVQSAVDSIAEGNIVENYSADAMRMTKDGETARHNVLKWAFAPDGEGDKNHDDAIQCFLHNKGTGTMRRLTIESNIIEGHHPSVMPHAAVNQAIGLFDGPLIDFQVNKNVVMTDHWHGVSVFDGQNCTITKNVVWSRWTDKSRHRPWVMLGDKKKQAKNNTVKDNYAFSYKLKQPGTIEENNKPITKEIYEQAYKELAKEIADKYGRIHVASMRDRFTGKIVEALPEENSEDQKDKKDKAKKLAKKKAKKVIKASDAALDSFALLLRKRLDEHLQSGKRQVRFVYSAFKQEVSIEGQNADKYKVNIPKMGSVMTIDLFKRLKTADAYAMAKQVHVEDLEESHALMAFYAHLNKDSRNYKSHLAKSGVFKQQVISSFE